MSSVTKSKVLDPFKKEFVRASGTRGKAIKRLVEMCDFCEDTKIYDASKDKCVDRDSLAGKKLKKYINFCVKYRREIIKFNTQDKKLVDNLLKYRFKNKEGKQILFEDLIKKETRVLKNLKNYDDDNIIHKKVAPIALAMIRGMAENPEVKDNIRLKVVNVFKNAASSISKFIRGLGIELSSSVIFTALTVLSDSRFLSKIVEAASSFFKNTFSRGGGAGDSGSMSPTPNAPGIRIFYNPSVNTGTLVKLRNNNILSRDKLDLGKLGLGADTPNLNKTLTFEYEPDEDIFKTNIQYNTETGEISFGRELKDGNAFITVPTKANADRDRRIKTRLKKDLNLLKSKYSEFKNFIENQELRLKLTKKLDEKRKIFDQLMAQAPKKSSDKKSSDKKSSYEKKLMNVSNSIGSLTSELSRIKSSAAPSKEDVVNMLGALGKTEDEINILSSEISNVTRKNINRVYKPALTRIKFLTSKIESVMTPGKENESIDNFNQKYKKFSSSMAELTPYSKFKTDTRDMDFVSTSNIKTPQQSQYRRPIYGESRFA